MSQGLSSIPFANLAETFRICGESYEPENWEKIDVILRKVVTQRLLNQPHGNNDIGLALVDAIDLARNANKPELINRWLAWLDILGTARTSVSASRDLEILGDRDAWRVLKVLLVSTEGIRETLLKRKSGIRDQGKWAAIINKMDEADHVLCIGSTDINRFIILTPRGKKIAGLTK